MIDYLLRFDNELEGAGSLPSLAPEFPSEGWQWNTSCCLPNVRCFREAGTEVIVDPEAGEVEVPLRDYLPGWYMIVSLNERDDSALPMEPVVLIADRETGVILHAITSPEDLATLKLEPVFAGSNYPFGSPLMG